MRNNKALFKLLIVLLFILEQMPGYGQSTYFVTTTGAGSMDGSSWVNASDDLQKMMDGAAAGDQIWVAQGTYLPTEKRDIDNSGTADLRETIFYLNKNIKIYGGFTGTESALSERDWELHPTILSGDLGTINVLADNSYHVLFIDASSSIITNDCVVDGFYFRLGNANGTSDINQRAGGIYLDGRTNLCSPLLNQIFISQNSALYGGGIFADAETGTCSPQITHSHIENNSVTKDGGGIYFNAIGGVSSSMIKNCIFDNNTATNFGGAVFHLVDQAGATNNPEYSNCIFTRNSAQDGGGMVNESINGLCAPVFRNSTFFMNTAGKDNGVMYNNQMGGICTPLCINSILWNNEDEIENVNGATVQLDYCIFDDGTPDNILSYPTNVFGVGFMSDQNPQFVNEASFDLHVMPTSPAIDNGNSGNIGFGITEDLDGKPRVNHSAVDLGPYEYFCPLGNPIYVNHAAMGRGDGNSWADAFTDIQPAIDLACACDTGTTLSIWVAQGTYYPNSFNGVPDTSRNRTILIQEDVKLYGGFEGTETQLSQRDFRNHPTVLSGDKNIQENLPARAIRVVTINQKIGIPITSDMHIDGFSITKGLANAGSGKDEGAGMTIQGTSVNQCKPRLENMNFSENVARTGGALYISNAEPRIVNTEFRKDSATLIGGAVWLSNASPIFVGCAFYKNYATSTGGAIGFSGISGDQPLFINNSFVENITGSHVDAGGAIRTTGDAGILQVLNSIFRNNQDEILVTGEGQVLLEYCLINPFYIPSTGVNVSNMIYNYPDFIDLPAGNLRLAQSSPATNSGIFSGLLPSEDLDGNPRVTRVVDLGAYENPYAGCPQTLTLDNILYTPLNGTYQAQQSIQLGAGMEILNTAQVTLNAPEVLFEESTVQQGGLVEVTQDGCTIE